jgi:hypothetical protein
MRLIPNNSQLLLEYIEVYMGDVGPAFFKIVVDFFLAGSLWVQGNGIHRCPVPRLGAVRRKQLSEPGRSRRRPDAAVTGLLG